MKIKDKTLAHKLKGKVSKNRTTRSKDSGMSMTFLTIDGALIAKALNKKKTGISKVQKLLRNRYGQLECMYKLLTVAQYNLLYKYTEYYNTMHQTNLTTAQIFKKLGMKYKLSDYITSMLNPRYTLSLEKKTSDYIHLMLFLDCNETPVHILSI